jgi:hypothetical protein
MPGLHSLPGSHSKVILLQGSGFLLQKVRPLTMYDQYAEQAARLGILTKPYVEKIT